MDNQVTQLTTELKFIKHGRFFSVPFLSHAVPHPRTAPPTPGTPGERGPVRAH